jgi:hypothetical protein
VGKHGHHKHKNNINPSNKSYKIYYGIPHAHCSYSSGKGSPLTAYSYARKKKLNFLALTDHNSFLNQNICIKDKKISKWEATKHYANVVNKKHKYFTALCGFECKIKSVGDINIYNSESLPIQHFKDLRVFTRWLKEDMNRVGSINHPHNSVNHLLKYPELNKYITLMEVGNGSYPFKYVRYYDIFFSFLDNGWKLGAINAQDNHKENWGDEENLTAILAENLNSKSIIDAYKNRRTYATESMSLKVNFKINSALMGETLSRALDEILNFSIEVEDDRYPINSIQIISNRKTLIKSETYTSSNKLKLSFSHNANLNETWYSLIIYQSEKKQALISPIFLEIKT